MNKIIAWELLREKSDGSKETYVRGDIIKRIFFLDHVGPHNFDPVNIEDFFNILHSFNPQFNICKLHKVIKNNEKTIEVYEHRYPSNGLIEKEKLNKPEWAEYLMKLLKHKYIEELDADHYQCKKNLHKTKIMELDINTPDELVNVLQSSYLGSHKNIATAFAFLHSLPVREFKKFKFYERMDAPRIITDYINYTSQSVRLGENLLLQKYIEKFKDELSDISRMLNASKDHTKDKLLEAFLYGDLNDMNYFMSDGKSTLFDWDETRIDLRIWEFTRYLIYGGHGKKITNGFVSLP